MALYQLDEDGFFTEVCGKRVIKESCLDLDRTTWDKGHPLGVMFHYQAGCGDSLAALYRGQGYVEAHASVSQKAEIRQYLPLKHAGWHAREASKRYIGLENAVRPGSCELTDEMLEAGASFFASSVAYVRKHYGVAIPVKKVPWPEHACDIDQMGFREHHDGINASGVGGCFWNDLVHVDGLRKWSWKQFCDRVNHYLMGEEEELDDQQAKELAETADFVKGLVRGIEAQDVPSRNATDQLKNAYSAGRKIREVWEATKP